MAETIESSLRVEWETLKRANKKTISQLKDMLAKCVEAGVEIVDPVRREQLQAIAREVADDLFLQTDFYPESVIRPPGLNLIVAKPIGDEQYINSRSQPHELVDSGKTLLRVGIVVSMVFTVTIGYLAWRYHGQTSGLDSRLKTTIAQLEESRSEVARLMEAAQPDRIDKTLGEVIRERNTARFAKERLEEVLEQTMSTLPPVVQETLAKDNCLKLIRGCYVDRNSPYHKDFEGAFGVTANPTEIWVVPSQANLAALALIAVAKHKSDSASTLDKQRVRKWLNWFATWQEKSGTDDIPTFTGTSLKKEQPIPSDEFDRDAAGTFLRLAQQYYEYCDKPPQAEHECIHKAVVRSVKSILSHTRPKQTALESPPVVTHLLTGVVDFGGLIAASRYYDRLGDKKASKDAQLRAKGIAVELRAFWQTQKTASLFAKFVNDGRYEVTLNSQEDLRANLVGIAYINWDNQQLWSVLSSKFSATGQNWLKSEFATGNTEDWLAASIRLSQTHKAEFDQAAWRTRVYIMATSYGVHTTHIERVARTLLVMQDGCEWWPDIRDALDKPKSE